MTSSDPEAIRRQIEDTRRELSYDVDALNEKVNPARVVDRRMTATKGRITRARDRVMGSASDTSSTVQGRASDAASTVQDAASSAAGAVQQAPEAITRQTQGNPLAAGLIAFGVGWLVSSLLPASQKEQELAQQAEAAVREHRDTLIEPAKQAAQEIGEELKPAAQQAAQEVKATAQEATSTVAEEGRSAAQDVQAQAQQSRETVQSHSSRS
ncbi:DUF3618 domain-containing protein [Geodermatophilus sp. YIM 151500]|uniref:DUF3618 domain-containing protein n=1 Tax=Geodermatophilus sp. YIM 151500 TaxID=2984531 RepID=UPI0021E38121|nr:DUF3618 domain-containing protein [Geodermatophilus sp. YIM 151500]MCV2491599.1 DUF3618 domain-containing protein [Geodermatophilus sp. YIM 151500]